MAGTLDGGMPEDVEIRIARDDELEAVLATARERGAEHVTVHTSAESIRIYAPHGFEPNEPLLWTDSAIAER